MGAPLRHLRVAVCGCIKSDSTAIAAAPECGCDRYGTRVGSRGRGFSVGTHIHQSSPSVITITIVISISISIATSIIIAIATLPIPPSPPRSQSPSPYAPSNHHRHHPTQSPSPPPSPSPADLHLPPCTSLESPASFEIKSSCDIDMVSAEVELRKKWACANKARDALRNNEFQDAIVLANQAQYLDPRGTQH